MNSIVVACNNCSTKNRIPADKQHLGPKCGPCRMLAPVIDSMTRKFYGRVIIAKLDTSRNQIAATQYRIKGVPTLLFFNNGTLVDQVTGAPPEQELTRLLEEFA